MGPLCHESLPRFGAFVNIGRNACFRLLPVHGVEELLFVEADLARRWSEIERLFISLSAFG